MSSSDQDGSDEDWKKSTKKKRATPAKKGDGGSKPRAVVKAVKLSPDLADIVGEQNIKF